ncbi:hypothetical protein J14TS2_33070 [Bacillus sp. J14TS2]|nr:hypothetical protein J14TS2_33070 [Bacillus sp. J14TS2]
MAGIESRKDSRLLAKIHSEKDVGKLYIQLSFFDILRKYSSSSTGSGSL